MLDILIYLVASSKQEVLECLFDIGSDIKNQPLGKFRADIAKELGLIDF